MTRAFLVVLDSAGCGGAPDAGDFFNGDVPDTGANTIGHIALYVPDAGAAFTADQSPSAMARLTPSAPSAPRIAGRKRSKTSQ